MGKHKGLIIITSGIIFNIIETLYYGRGAAKGFNMFPASLGEYICDSIALITIIIGYYIAANDLMNLKR